MSGRGELSGSGRRETVADGERRFAPPPPAPAPGPARFGESAEATSSASSTPGKWFSFIASRAGLAGASCLGGGGATRLVPVPVRGETTACIASAKPPPSPPSRRCGGGEGSGAPTPLGSFALSSAGAASSIGVIDGWSGASCDRGRRDESHAPTDDGPRAALWGVAASPCCIRSIDGRVSSPGAGAAAAGAAAAAPSGSAAGWFVI